jgi:hypothetical protein
MRLALLAESEFVYNGFVTAAGSSYTMDKEGHTQRTKAQHSTHGAGDVGLKEKSELTVYVTQDDAQRVGDFQRKQRHKYDDGKIENVTDTKIVIDDGKAYLLFTTGRKWIMNGQPFKFFKDPDLGLSPLEFWKENKLKIGNDVHVAYDKFHPGNKITKWLKDGVGH